MTGMRRRSFQALAIAALTLPTLTAIVGCGGNDRADGTQVQEDEKTKAMINDMKSDMLKAERK